MRGNIVLVILNGNTASLQTAHCVARHCLALPRHAAREVYDSARMKVELSDRRCEFTSGHSGFKVDMSTVDFKTSSALFCEAPNAKGIPRVDSSIDFYLSYQLIREN